MSFINKVVNKIHREGANLFTANRHCIICDRRFKRKFIPLNNTLGAQLNEFGFRYSLDDFETLNHKEYNCPYCYSTDRERLFQLYFNKKLDPLKRYKVLDIAPSAALTRKLKSMQMIDYRSADLYIEADDEVDIMDMRIYEENRFDIFICSHVLEHVESDILAMKELYRILKPGGFGIAMVPIMLATDEIDEDPLVKDEGERWRRFAQNDHVRLYSKKGFRERLLSVGFGVEEWNGELNKRDFVKHGLSTGSVLYIVRK